MKYAGLFDEQPMPLIFITRSGSTPISNIASIMRSLDCVMPAACAQSRLAAAVLQHRQANVIQFRARRWPPHSLLWSPF